MQYKIIYGIHSVERALKKDPSKILELIALGGKNKRILTLLSVAKQHNIKVNTLNAKQLEVYCNSDKHQGIAVKVQFDESNILSEDDLLELVEDRKCSFLLILDEVQDPHNLGAILRTADAAGVQAVVVPENNSVKLTSTVSKVACGAAETVPFVQVKNLARFLRLLHSLGVWVVGADMEQEQMIYDIDLTGRIAIVMGAEGRGLRNLTIKHCDHLVSIPMCGQVESLNVSVATGVCLYEIVRQRNMK